MLRPFLDNKSTRLIVGDTRVARPIHELIREARRLKGLTQADLAREVNCKQPAVSMYERGKRDALAASTVDLIAKKLGISTKPAAESESGEPAGVRQKLKYCPSDLCPANVPYAVGDELCFMPTMIRAPADEATFCGYCGEPLESRCLNDSCPAEIREGAFCHACGARRVTVARSVPGSPGDWAERERARIKDLKELMRYRTNVDGKVD
jgi:transcriptional regulator with XRE-family HTH domain